MSFNMPHTQNELSTGCTLSKLYPELQQLNVDKMIMVPIPASSYSEFIDGRSITLTVPQHGAPYTPQKYVSGITIHSSTYSSDKILKSETSPLLGDNIVYLFADKVNRPYTGDTINELGSHESHKTIKSWSGSTGNYVDRPSAVSYAEVKDRQTGILAHTATNSDQRTNTSWAVTVPSNYPDNRAGYNYDIPVGFAVLDKGYLVITHPQIVNNFPWTSGNTNTSTSYIESGEVDDKTNIFFTGQTYGNVGQDVSSLTFTDVNTSFKTTAVCIGMPREFYISNNPSWNRKKALAEINEQTGVVNFDPVYVTEVGLFNALGELVAIAKLSEPVEKNYVNVLTFNLDIEM
jgi:hypothetical protein